MVLGYLLVDDCHVSLLEFSNDAMIRVLLRNTTDQFFAQLAKLCFRKAAPFHTEFEGSPRIAAEDGPHAIAFDGFRWHARAFCVTDEVFKDFLLSRILDIRASRASDVLPENDQDWHTFATLEIGPHPALSETQAKVIALDYGMKGGKAEIRVRRALLYYALRRLGLDTDPAARKPQDQQIVLLNHIEVQRRDERVVE